MKQEIKVPSMGESISEATISAILKPPGSVVQMDDELLELATDKVNQVLYAPQTGIFMPTVKEEDVVNIGQVVGYIDVQAGATETVAAKSGQLTEKSQSEKGSPGPQAPHKEEKMQIEPSAAKVKSEPRNGSSQYSEVV